jgi:hypothetical protein
MLSRSFSAGSGVEKKSMLRPLREQAYIKSMKIEAKRLEQ